MKIADISIKRPIGLIMIVLAVLALGFVSLNGLKVDLYPNIDLPIAAVTTTYPDAGPQEVERLVTRPLEASLSTLQGISTIQSVSQPGSALILLMFQNGTNLDNALLEVRERVDQVKSFLPDAANDPSVLRFDPQQIPIMYLALEGEDVTKLEQIAENRVIPYLERVADVASVTASGAVTREIQVILDQAKLNQYGLSANQVIQALQMENQSASGGVISKGSQELQIRIEGEFRSIDDIEKTMIPLPTGGHILITDVSEIVDTFKKQTMVTEVNGSRALLLSVLKQSDGNTVNAAQGLHRAIERVNESLPDGVKLSIIMDTSTFITSSIKSVTNNLLIGGIVSLIILILFLKSVRPVIVIGVSIPIAIISTFTLMYFTGQTLNIISLGGLALGVGLVIDNSIVILENIFSHRQRGESKLRAASIGTAELGPAVIAATLTTLVVFVPVLFVEGIASDLFTPMALTVSFSLFASLIVAITIVPMLSSRLLSQKAVEKQFVNKGFTRAFNAFNNKYKSALQWALNHRKTTVFVTLFFFIGSFFLIPFIGAELAPEGDQGMLQINIETPTGTKFEETEKIVHQVQEHVQKYESIIDSNYVTIGGSDYALVSGSNQATFSIQLVPSTERDITTKQVMAELSDAVQNIVGADIEVLDISASFSTGSPILIKLSGQEHDVLKQISDELVWLISEIDGTVNVKSTMSEGRPEIQVVVDREMLQAYGLSYMQVMQQINFSFNGQVATQIREDGYEYDVRVTLPEDSRQTISDLETLLIQTHSGTMIPLSAVAELKQVQGPASINREDQQRQVHITSDIMGRDLISINRDIVAVLDQVQLPDGYDISIGGETEDIEETFTELGIALIFAIFLIYTVMAVQFESIVYPFAVMFSMPTMLIGVFFGLFITGTPISMVVFVGLIMLAGIVVNNAILLIDYTNQLRRIHGKERNEAIIIAGPARMRPILMTTLTTVIAMIPIALGIGEGAEMQAPIGITIVFGLTTSAMFTLLFVPVMYTYLDDIGNWFGRVIFRRKKSESTEPTEINTVQG